jgi:hypothetical protein
MKVIREDEFRIARFLPQLCFDARQDLERKDASNAAAIQSEQALYLRVRHQLNLGT